MPPVRAAHKMQADGLIEGQWEEKETGRKRRYYHITDKGKEAYELTTKRGPIHRILGTLNKEERKDFHGYLERVLSKSREELGMDRDDLPPSE